MLLLNRPNTSTQKVCLQLDSDPPISYVSSASGLLGSINKCIVFFVEAHFSFSLYFCLYMVRGTENLTRYPAMPPLKEEFEGVTIRTAILDQNWRSISCKSDGSRSSDRVRGRAYMQNPLETSEFAN